MARRPGSPRTPVATGVPPVLAVLRSHPVRPVDGREVAARLPLKLGPVQWDSATPICAEIECHVMAITFPE